METQFSYRTYKSGKVPSSLDCTLPDLFRLPKTPPFRPTSSRSNWCYVSHIIYLVSNSTSLHKYESASDTD